MLTVAIWSTHASGANAGLPDSPLYTLIKPAGFVVNPSGPLRFDAPPNSVLGAGKTYAVVMSYNKSFDNVFNAPSWSLTPTTAEHANPAPGWSIGNTTHARPAGSTSWRPRSDPGIYRAQEIRVNGTAGGGEPVWSATMTAGDTPVGHGYDATDTPAVGTLDGDDFDYGSIALYGRCHRRGAECRQIRRRGRTFERRTPDAGVRRARVRILGSNLSHQRRRELVLVRSGRS